MNERCHGSAQPYREASYPRGSLPCARREEVEEPGTERKKVCPIAQVFHQKQFTSNAEYPRNFAEELYASFMTPEFVGREDQENSLELPVLRGEFLPVCVNR